MGSLSEAMALSRGGGRIDAKGVAQGGGSGGNPGGSGGVSFNVDMRDFSNMLGHVMRESGRSATETVKYGMILMLTAGRAATPKGKKNRTIAKVQSVETRKRSDAFAVWYQGKREARMIRLPTGKGPMSKELRAQLVAARADRIRRFRAIERVGIAKASWGWALKKYCGTGSTVLSSVGRIDHDPVTGQTTPLSMTVENRLGWIGKLVPGIEQRMVKSAVGRMSKWMENRWQTGIDKAARRAR
jgi:hypothetical protein